MVNWSAAAWSFFGRHELGSGRWSTISEAGSGCGLRACSGSSGLDSGPAPTGEKKRSASGWKRSGCGAAIPSRSNEGRRRLAVVLNSCGDGKGALEHGRAQSTIPAMPKSGREDSWVGVGVAVAKPGTGTGSGMRAGRVGKRGWHGGEEGGRAGNAPEDPASSTRSSGGGGNDEVKRRLWSNKSFGKVWRRSNRSERPVGRCWSMDGLPKRELR